MGLDTSHDAWHGSYSTFNDWRRMVAGEAGFPPLEEMRGFGGDTPWEGCPGDHRLVPLLDHSDCDGEISPEDCVGVADALEDLLVPDYEDPEFPVVSYWRDVTRQFAVGCRAAAEAGEPLEFR